MHSICYRQVSLMAFLKIHFKFTEIYRGHNMNTIQKFYIYQSNTQDVQLNNTHTDTNPIAHVTLNTPTQQTILNTPHPTIHSIHTLVGATHSDANDTQSAPNLPSPRQLQRPLVSTPCRGKSIKMRTSERYHHWS